MQRLNEIEALTDNWNGNNAPPPAFSKKIIEKLGALFQLCKATIYLPY